MSKLAHILSAAIAAILLALLPATAFAQSETSHLSALGTWMNPHGTVKVEIANCSGNICGWIVWAAPQAQSDARESGVTKLVGTELLRNYRSTGPGRYQGQVYVPDMGQTFYSTIKQPDADNLKISGCILGGLICKSQNWHRS